MNDKPKFVRDVMETAVENRVLPMIQQALDEVAREAAARSAADNERDREIVFKVMHTAAVHHLFHVLAEAYDLDAMITM